MSNLLLNSLLDLYKDDYETTALLKQCSLDTLQNNFNRELYARLSKEECDLAQEILTCELVQDYDKAIREATFVLTKDIADLLDLVLTRNQNGYKGIN